MPNWDDLYYSGGVNNLGISYHGLIFTNRKKKKNATYKQICRSYRKFAPKWLQQEVNNTDWKDIRKISKINNAVKTFQNRLVAIVEKHSAATKLNMRQFALEWIISDDLAHIHKREFWSKQFDKCLCPYHLTQNL